MPTVTTPALSAKSNISSAKDPMVSVFVIGPQTDLTILNKTLSCSLSLPVNSWAVEGYRNADGFPPQAVSLTESQSVQLTGKNITIRNYDSFATLTNDYLKNAEAFLKVQYRDAGEDSLRTNRCQ